MKDEPSTVQPQIVLTSSTPLSDGAPLNSAAVQPYRMQSRGVIVGSRTCEDEETGRERRWSMRWTQQHLLLSSAATLRHRRPLSLRLRGTLSRLNGAIPDGSLKWRPLVTDFPAPIEGQRQGRRWRRHHHHPHTSLVLLHSSHPSPPSNGIVTSALSSVSVSGPARQRYPFDCSSVQATGVPSTPHVTAV